MVTDLVSQGEFVDPVTEKHAIDTQRAASKIPEHSLEQQRPEDDLTRKWSDHLQPKGQISNANY